MASPPQIMSDEWNTYVAERDDVTMFISFDEAVARSEPPSGLDLCARVMIPIHSPNPAGGPSSPEAERLWEMEEALVEKLQEHEVRCRLVARLTYGGLREIVFQLHDWDSFRPPVGLWIMEHEDYDIDVSEHEGWQFYDEYVRPRVEDELFMADDSVIRALVDSGSDPSKEHSLEYVFLGDADGLKQVISALRARGYTAVDGLDPDSGQIVMAIRLPLDFILIMEQSLANHQLAEEAGVEFNGWGAHIVK